MSDYFDRVERQLVRKVEAGAARRSRFPVHRDHLAVAASLLVVIAVGAVFVGVRGSTSTGSRTSASPTVRVAFSASPLNPRASLASSIERSAAVLRRRLDSIAHGVKVSVSGNDVVVVVPKSDRVSRERIVAMAAPARLEFYDWEANALTPNGKTVVSQLQRQAPTALKISQGSGGAAPGAIGAGSLPLYEAVVLASKQPPLTTADSARAEPQYYLFGAPGSAACRTAAGNQRLPAVADVHCLLAGPARDAQALSSELPAGVSVSQGRQLKVPRGIIVLQAAGAVAPNPTPFASPAAQFYVLRDNLALSGTDITNVKPSTDQAGSPDVAFGFTAAGASGFRNVTADVAQRGDVVSRLGQALDQHFAVALDDQLVTVPSIDFKQYPDGISGGGGADLTGDFSSRSARTFATLLRYGPLSVDLTPQTPH